MPYEVKIDMEKFCRAYIDGATLKEAYKEAGYVQEGRVDNSKRLASRYLARQDVQKMLKGMQDGIYEAVKSWSIKALYEFTQNGYSELPPKEQAKFLKEMMDVTGQSAAKRVDVTGMESNTNVNIQLDKKAIASQLLALTEVNPHVSGLISQAVGQSEIRSSGENSGEDASGTAE